jgi:hypothetical protein
MIRAFSGTIQTVEGAGLGGLVLLLAVAVLFLALAAVLSRSARGTRQAAGPQIQPQIVEALSVYLGGNRDSARLRAMATAHPDEVQETILRYQTIVAGQREELCELTIVLGYVQRWCRQTRFAGIVERRKAFSCLSAVAHYEGVRRLAGDIPANAFRDPDEQIRLEAARILLSTNEPAEIGRVFEGILSDTPGVRLVIGRELGRYATQLCQTAVPRALRSQSPLEVLRLLVSWERALPLPDVSPLVEHPDPAVRVEVMRLLRLLPATSENHAAILSGLTDADCDVKAAAAATAGWLRLPNRDPLVSHAPGASRETSGPSAITFANWRMLDAED